MQLNLPINHLLENSENILIAGAGGGFDVFCGLPIYFTLRDMGKNVHLANYSFSPLEIVSYYSEVDVLRDGLLVGAKAGVPYKFNHGYFPEGYLSRWFKEVRKEDVTIWMFAKVGPSLLNEFYQQLVEHLKIDTLILIDGGVDSLMIGDEVGAGTLLEDTISLTATFELDIPTKILACIGFGSELEVSHHNVLANMSALIVDGAFYGSCALTKEMPAYAQYEAACRYVWEQPSHYKSQINMRIVSATLGAFGNHHMYHDYLPLEVYVSPLMSLYWFFDAEAVARRSMLRKAIEGTATIQEAHAQTIKLRALLMSKARQNKTLPY
ncbi:MAG: DUF1152 domain-containing protein [Anaerolineae bacterium]|nr:DUF1152 domain-containing protein [Anaerolineae bacterium]